MKDQERDEEMEGGSHGQDFDLEFPDGFPEAPPAPPAAPPAGLLNLVQRWIAADDELSDSDCSPIRKDILAQNALDAKERVRLLVEGVTTSPGAWHG